MRLRSQAGLLCLQIVTVILVAAAAGRADDTPISTFSFANDSMAQAPANAANAGVAAAPAGGQPAPPAAMTSPDESAANVATSSTPNMIGDQGPGHLLTFSLTSIKTGTRVGVTSSSISFANPSAGILGRQRIADNDCVLPTDRVFVDYSYFHDAYSAGPADADRFVPGFEKTFLDGRMSLELRFPIGDLVSNNLVLNGANFGASGQFGDIQIITKAILLQKDTWTLSGGLGISVPTAPNVNIAQANGLPLLQIANQSTHLLPFLGLLVKPDDDWFVQAFVQIDIAASGDPVSLQSAASNTLQPSGSIYDQTMLFADASVGRWLYRNPGQRFSALAAVLEAHYTGGLNAPSAIQPFPYTLGYGTAEYNVLDLVVGAHAVVGHSTITAGYATPLTNDRGFEGELRLFVNRTF